MDFEQKVHSAVLFKQPGTTWIDANDAMAKGLPVPFFVVPRRLLSATPTSSISTGETINSLIDTPITTVPLDTSYMTASTETAATGVGKKRKTKMESLTEEFDEDEGVTHRVQNWELVADDGGKLKLVRKDETEEWTKSTEGKAMQRQLLSSFKQAASQPDERVRLNTKSAVFIPLINNTSHVPQHVIDSWVELAEKFEDEAFTILRDCNQLPPDFHSWTDIINRNALPPSIVGEGFSALRPEAFVKGTLSFTLEHMEHFGSTSVNIYPLQHRRPSGTPALSPLSSSSSSISSSSAFGTPHIAVPSAIPFPPSTPSRFRFRSRNLWRGWLMSDVATAFLTGCAQFKNHKRFTRRDLHNFYVDNFLGDEFGLTQYIIDVLKVPTYYVFQEEGDVVMTTHLGSHDVVYVGGPSFQVSMNLGFSLAAATQLLEDFSTTDRDGFDGNDASNTGFVFRRFLRTCWPGDALFKKWYPKYHARDVKVRIF